MPSPQRILEVYDCDIENGIIKHKKSRVAKTPPKLLKHKLIVIDGVSYLAHRVIYFLATGVDPGHLYVDHINHNPIDNRPCNLRLATLKENTRNLSGARADSSTGIRGVRWRERDKFWYASVRANGKSHHIGCFKTKEDAVNAVTKARQSMFGEFAGGD